MPPSVPALTPQGFVRWQTIQLLLQPEEHVPFLQAAVKRFEITNPGDGAPFPKILPKESLPSKADVDMIQWHESVAEKLQLEAQAYHGRGGPVALGDGDPENSVTSSVNGESVGNPTGYSFGPRPHRFDYATSSSRSGACAASNLPWQHPHHHPYEQPWTAERRRTDTPSSKSSLHHPTWRRDGPTPTGRRSPSVPLHRRFDSSQTISTVSSSSSSSSPTTSSASVSPVLQSSHLSIRSFPTSNRRHSMSHPHDARHHAPDNIQHPPRPRPQTSYFPQLSPQHPPPPRAGAGAHRVRWRDKDDENEFPRSAPGTPRGEPWVRHGEVGREHGRGYESGDEKKRRMTSPLRGVGGRRYSNEGRSGR
jgi:hypothetical protein